MKIKDLEAKYKEQAERRKAKIRLEPNKFKRFWKWVWYLIAFPWIWLFYNARDWRSVICIIISFALWSASVWLFYLLYFLTQNAWFLGIGSAVWLWWISPVGSPFILLVTITAIGMKALFNKIKQKRNLP
jgi:hypothetical protein